MEDFDEKKTLTVFSYQDTGGILQNKAGIVTKVLNLKKLFLTAAAARSLPGFSRLLSAAGGAVAQAGGGGVGKHRQDRQRRRGQLHGVAQHI